MSIKKAETYRSKQTLSVFDYDPNEEFKNVKRDFKGEEVVSSFGSFQMANGGIAGDFVHSGEKVAVSPDEEIQEGQHPTLIKLPQDFKSFLDGWEVIKPKKIKRVK